MQEEAPQIQKQEEDPVLEEALSHLMTAEEYAEIYAGREWGESHVFPLEKGDKKLYYFGSPHVNDPSHPIFAEIEKAFNEAQPEIVFVEGVTVYGDINRFNERMKAGPREGLSESGFVIKLALEKGAEWHSPEPTFESLYAHLLQDGFSKDQIFAEEVLGMLPQYHRELTHGGFEKYVESYIKHFQQDTNWENFDYSYENAIQIAESILGRKIDVENEPNPTSLIDPIPWEHRRDTQTVLNQASRATSVFRDRQIVREIAEALKTYNKIFVVYGSTHAVVQEPALRKLFENL